MPLTRCKWAFTLLLATLAGGCVSRPPLPAPRQPLTMTPDGALGTKPPPPDAVEFASTEPGTLQSQTLPNGLTVWVVTRRELPYAALSLVTTGAGTFMSACSPELLKLTARAMVEGGSYWTGGRVARELLVHGQSVGYQVGATHTALSLSVLRGGLAAGLSVISKTVRVPAFGEDGSLPIVQLAELKHLQESSGTSESMLLRMASRAMYGDAVSARLVPSRLDEVRGATRSALQRCHQDTFVPGHSALIVVGDTTLQEVLSVGGAELAAWPSGATALAPRRPWPRSQSDGRRLHWLRTRAGPQVDVLLLQQAPSDRSERDRLAFEILAHIAVGSMQSRANVSLRHSSGVTYEVEPSVVSARDGGVLAIRASFQVRDFRRGVAELLDMLTQLRSAPISAAELAEAKAAVASRYARQMHGNASFAALAGRIFAAGQPLEWLDQLPASFEAVTREDVQRVALKYLNARDVEVAVVGEIASSDLSYFSQIETYKAELE